MPKDTSFHDYVMQDVWGDDPRITSRPMFGGWGVYEDGHIFALIADGELYFKVDDTNRALFETLKNSRPFVYEKKDGKSVALSYWLIPLDILENRDACEELKIKM